MSCSNLGSCSCLGNSHDVALTSCSFVACTLSYAFVLRLMLRSIRELYQSVAADGRELSSYWDGPK